MQLSPFRNCFLCLSDDLEPAIARPCQRRDSLAFVATKLSLSLSIAFPCPRVLLLIYARKKTSGKTKEGREAERIEKANKPSPQYFLIILSVRDSGSTIAIPVERPITRKLMSVPLRKLLRTLGYLNFFTSLYIYQGGLKDFDITRIFQM